MVQGDTGWTLLKRYMMEREYSENSAINILWKMRKVGCLSNLSQKYLENLIIENRLHIILYTSLTPISVYVLL